MVPKKIRNVIDRFKRELKKARLPVARVYLFGSYARNEALKDSDIDVCLVSPSFSRNKERYRKTAVVIAYNVDPRLQIVLAAPRDIKANSLSPLFNSIYKESIAA